MIKRKKINIYPKKEILLNNIVEKDFQRLLLPLNILQSLFLYPKYMIRDNFITPNRWPVNFVSFIATCVYLTMLVIKGMFINYTVRNVTFFKTLIKNLFDSSRIISFILTGLGHINNFKANATHSIDNVSLVLKLQKIFKTLRYNKERFRKVVIFNWCYSIVVFLDFYTFYSYVNFWHKSFFLIDFLTDCTMFSFDVNVLYAIRMMVLMTNNILSWTEELKIVKKNNTKEKAVYWNNMFEIYATILASYKIYIKVFQELILHFVTDTFFHTLTYIQSWITYTETNTSNKDSSYRIFLSMGLFLIIMWLLKNLLFISILGRSVEKFYIALESTQTLSTMLLASSKCDEAEKRMYKNVQRLYRSNFTKINLKGMFNVDVSLPCNIAYLTTAYVIVLLQFSFI